MRQVLPGSGWATLKWSLVTCPTWSAHCTAAIHSAVGVALDLRACPYRLSHQVSLFAPQLLGRQAWHTLWACRAVRQVLDKCLCGQSIPSK